MKQPKVCTVDGCGSATLSKGFCNKHYQRMQKYGSADLPPRAKDRLCSECGERWALYSSGQCQACYRRGQLNAQPYEGICAHCGEPFVSQRRYAPGSGRGLYCSRKCKGLAWTASGEAAAARRKSYYLKHYGLTLEQVQEMRARGCAICGEMGVEGRWGNLHMDHDHKSGRFRGPLCHNCNTGIGRFNEDPDLLRKAIAYLTRPPLTP